MDKMNVNRKSISVKLQRLLMMMAAIMMALACLTACDENENGEDDPDGNGNGGGVAGKRIKTTLQTDASGETSRGERTYNNDGSLNRIDYYDASSKRTSYQINTNNPDGTPNKWEDFNTSGNSVVVFTYDSNKKPLKGEGTGNNGAGVFPITYDFTYQNGRKIGHVIKIGTPGTNGYSVITYESKYDSNGRRTTTTETLSAQGFMGTRQITRTYNSDGTIQKIIADDYSMYSNTGYTLAFTWEDGKTTLNFDDFSPY